MIPVYMQIFSFTLMLIFVIKENTKKKCDIVVYQKGSVEDITHVRRNQHCYIQISL